MMENDSVGGGLSCIDNLPNILFSISSILLSSVGSCGAGGSFGVGGLRG